jgi:response regulator of citrate/malate metabolism
VIRTLVVDDDFRVADLHCEFVERVSGFVATGRAHSGAEALELVDRLRPELLLLDFYLPDQPGLEVLRRLREEEHPAVDVIAITAARDVENVRAAMRGGVVHYLIKPFRFATFEEKLASYASARARLARMSQADQAEVDRVFGTLRAGSRGPALPKGLSDATLRLVVRTLRAARSGLSAADVAEAAGLSRVTARRYLDHLCRLGSAEVTMRYGGPGRPEHRYLLL